MTGGRFDGRTLRRGLLVTGTDTGVGKTIVTAGIVAALRSAGVAVRPLKPVESGTDDHGGVSADSALLAACAGLARWQDANVVALREPLAPTVAAERQGVTLAIEALDQRVAAVAADEALIVEGVGGALVEVVPGVTVADLPARWGLRTLVVAGNRLGVLNHTLLTVEALQARGAEDVCVVLSTVQGGPASVAESTNAAALARLLPADVRLLPTVPFVAEAGLRDPRALAQALRDTTTALGPV